MITIILVSTLFTWLLYLAVMSLKRARGELHGPIKVIGYAIAFIGVVIDVIYNVIIGSIIFFEIPKELLFTARCDRHIPQKTWRGSLARWICKYMLDPFDKGGKHCG